MGLRVKREQPVDRAVRELEQEIARVKRELRRAEQGPPPAAHPAAPAAAVPDTPDTMTRFVKKMLAPAAREVQPSYRVRNDLFDVADTPLEQLELEPIAFGDRAAAEPDLFHAADRDGAAAASDGAHGERQSAGGSKLVQYLSTGGIRSYKPLRRVQREERNRFFAWLGLAGAALWLLYVIVR